ncbi:hypothetical protein L6303_06415 [archaeon]|nr:hypothetical protein [Nanoarchaeota archaeon]MCG2724350.1 hypothetical protein [archaeon]
MDARRAEIGALCTDLCLNKSRFLLTGPCLSEEIVPGWTCDVAHNPRQEIDNLPENQCAAFRNRSVRHFVEVDENCKLIRAV